MFLKTSWAEWLSNRTFCVQNSKKEMAEKRIFQFLISIIQQNRRWSMWALFLCYVSSCLLLCNRIRNSDKVSSPSEITCFTCLRVSRVLTCQKIRFSAPLSRKRRHRKFDFKSWLCTGLQRHLRTGDRKEETKVTSVWMHQIISWPIG